LGRVEPWCVDQLPPASPSSSPLDEKDEHGSPTAVATLAAAAASVSPPATTIAGIGGEGTPKSVCGEKLQPQADSNLPVFTMHPLSEHVCDQWWAPGKV
jgi:hypothetical protein